MSYVISWSENNAALPDIVEHEEKQESPYATDTYLSQAFMYT